MTMVKRSRHIESTKEGRSMAKFKETKKQQALEQFKEGDSIISESRTQVDELTQISQIIGKLEVADDTDLKIIETTTDMYKREGEKAHREIEYRMDTVDEKINNVKKEIAEERKKVEYAKESADKMRQISDIGTSAAERALFEFEKSALEYQNMEGKNTVKMEALIKQEHTHKGIIDSLF